MHDKVVNCGMVYGKKSLCSAEAGRVVQLEVVAVGRGLVGVADLGSGKHELRGSPGGRLHGQDHVHGLLPVSGLLSRGRCRLGLVGYTERRILYEGNTPTQVGGADIAAYLLCLDFTVTVLRLAPNSIELNSGVVPLLKSRRIFSGTRGCTRTGHGLPITCTRSALLRTDTELILSVRRDWDEAWTGGVMAADTHSLRFET